MAVFTHQNFCWLKLFIIFARYAFFYDCSIPTIKMGCMINLVLLVSLCRWTFKFIFYFYWCRNRTVYDNNILLCASKKYNRRHFLQDKPKTFIILVFQTMGASSELLHLSLIVYWSNKAFLVFSNTIERVFIFQHMYSG